MQNCKTNETQFRFNQSERISSPAAARWHRRLRRGCRPRCHSHPHRPPHWRSYCMVSAHVSIISKSLRISRATSPVVRCTSWHHLRLFTVAGSRRVTCWRDRRAAHHRGRKPKNEKDIRTKSRNIREQQGCSTCCRRAEKAAHPRRHCRHRCRSPAAARVRRVLPHQSPPQPAAMQRNLREGNGHLFDMLQRDQL